MSAPKNVLALSMMAAMLAIGGGVAILEPPPAPGPYRPRRRSYGIGDPFPRYVPPPKPEAEQATIDAAQAKRDRKAAKRLAARRTDSPPNGGDRG